MPKAADQPPVQDRGAPRQKGFCAVPLDRPQRSAIVMTAASTSPFAPSLGGDPQAPIACVTGVSKAFGGVQALADISLELRASEVHAMCGENGAGKSTLIKILSGYYAPDAGRVEIVGQDLPPSVHAACELGVSVIHQESVACLDLDAVDNIFVGREPRRLAGLLLDRRAMLQHARALLDRLGESISLHRPIGELTLAQRQMIGIARALSQRCRLLIMDEPTASLSAREAETLFRIIRQLRSEGVAILYVSHRMEEIFELADRVTILRDGRHVATRPIGELTTSTLIKLMIGREVEPLSHVPAPRPLKAPAKRLEVRHLTQQRMFTDVSFSVNEGEVVGLAGLVGAGRSEIANAIFGVTGYEKGEVLIDGRPLDRANIAGRIERGLALVPEDRQREGLVLPMTVSENLTLTILRDLTCGGLVSRKAELLSAAGIASQLDVRAARLTLPAESLSGGNQQKLVIGKWLATEPRVLILDEPTRGVDVASKTEIHRRIRELSSQGLATLVISSELPEIIRLSDRILVMCEGRLAGELDGARATEHEILDLALPTRGDRPGRSTTTALPSRSPLGDFAARRELWLFVLLALICAVVGTTKPSFLSAGNLLDVGAEAAPAAIIACAVTLVIVAGEIDISVGSLAGFTAAILGLCCYGPNPPMSVAAGATCALAAALGVGVLNGMLVTLGRVPSIIATLGMLTVLRGVTKLIMKGRSIDGRPDALRDLATGSWLSIPNSMWIAAAVAMMLAIVCRRTPLGRRIYAVGSNAKAAPLLGVSVNAARFTAFALAGLMTGVAALLLTPKNSVIQPNLGEGLELLVVTCVVVGGTTISGGRGTILGTVLAVAFMSLIPTALTYVGAPAEWRLAIQGALILTAVLIDHYLQRRRLQGGAR